MNSVKNYLNVWFEVSPWSYRIAFFALGYSIVSLFIVQEEITMDKLIVKLDKFYAEQPWLFRAFLFMLGYVLTDLVVKATRK